MGIEGLLDLFSVGPWAEVLRKGRGRNSQRLGGVGFYLAEANFCVGASPLFLSPDGLIQLQALHS